MRAWLGAALVLLVGACGGSDADEQPGPSVLERPGTPDVGTGVDGGSGGDDAGPVDSGGPGAGGPDGGRADAGGTPAARTPPPPVQGAWRFGDRFPDGVGQVAWDADTGDVLLVQLPQGGGEVGSALPEGRVHLALVRLTAAGTPVWKRAYRMTADADTDETMRASSRGVAFAPGGGVWALLSWRYGSMDLGAGRMPTGDYLVNYAADGRLLFIRPMWSSKGGAQPFALATTAEGGVVVVGQFRAEVDFGGVTVSSNRDAQGSSVYTGFVVHYAADGTLRWVRTFGGLQANGAGYAVAVSSGGDVLVGGMAVGEAAFAGHHVPGSVERGVLARMSADGEVRWVKTVGQRVTHAAFSPLGTAVATGFGETLRWAGQELTRRSSFLVTAEVDGAERWMRTYQAGEILGLGVEAAGSARLLVASLPGADFGGGPEGATSSSPTYLVRVNLDGSWVWTRELPLWAWWASGDNDRVERPSLALARDGTAWTLGNFNGTWTTEAGTLTSVGSTDVYLLKVGP